MPRSVNLTVTMSDCCRDNVGFISGEPCLYRLRACIPIIDVYYSTLHLIVLASYSPVSSEEVICFELRQI